MLKPFLPCLGVLFLQYGDETRRVHITHELSSLDTLHALIVHMFPQKLTAGMLKSANTAILIKDEARNVFYELEDVRDIQDRSVIKIYRKEPIYASYPAAAHLANGDLRVSGHPLELKVDDFSWDTSVNVDCVFVFHANWIVVALSCIWLNRFYTWPSWKHIFLSSSRPSVAEQTLENNVSL